MEKMLKFLDQKFNFVIITIKESKNLVEMSTEDLLVHFKCISKSLLEGRIRRDSINLLKQSLYYKIQVLWLRPQPKKKNGRLHYNKKFQERRQTLNGESTAPYKPQKHHIDLKTLGRYNSGRYDRSDNHCFVYSNQYKHYSMFLMSPQSLLGPNCIIEGYQKEIMNFYKQHTSQYLGEEINNDLISYIIFRK